MARAVENRCAHRQIKLTIGHVKKCDLVCIYHGWSYDEHGRLVDMKHDHFGKKLPVLSIRSYPVRERYGSGSARRRSVISVLRMRYHGRC